MNARHQLFFLALVIARLAVAEPLAPPGSLPSPAPSAVWRPPMPGATPEASAAALASPAPAAEKTMTAVQPDGNAAVQQDTQVEASPVATPAPAPSRSDLLSTLANRQDQPVTLSIDEAAGVEMTREWRERAKEFESQNLTDGAVQFSWPQEIPSIVCAVLQVTDVAL